MTMLFFYNVAFDSSGLPVLGNGSDSNHLNIQITSKRLMENLSNNGIHHIDGTYRITTHGFPLIVYGLSDQVGRFHPVSFMITSHEKEEDFDVFYQGLVNLAEFFDIEFDPEYIMQDACDASLNSILKFFPEVLPLMCYFHVKKNVKETVAKENLLSKV